MILQLGLAHADNDESRHVLSVDDAATPESVARHALEGAMAAQWLIKAACCHPIAAETAQTGEDCAVRFVYNPNTNDSTIVHIVRGGKKAHCKKKNKGRRRKQLRAQRTMPQLVIELCLQESAREGGDVALPVMAGSPLGLFRGLGNPVVQGSLRVTSNGPPSLVDEDVDAKILRVYEKEGYPDMASHCVELGMGKVRNGADILLLEADGEHGGDGDDNDDSDDDDDDLGPLARSDARFVPHVRQANVRKAKRTPDLRERIESPPTRREMAAAILEASIDPFQSRIITPQKLENDETDSIESSGDWSSGGEDVNQPKAAAPEASSAGAAEQKHKPKQGTIEEINDASFKVPKKLEAKFHACETLEEKRAVLAAFRKRGREAVARSVMRKEALRKSGSHRQLQLQATRTTTSKATTRMREKRKRKSQTS